MNLPVKQHYVPRSYLKNFSTKTKENKLKIHASEKFTDRIINISIRDICHTKHFYTIPTVGGKDKFAIEAFYANRIESAWTRVYKLLITDTQNAFSQSEREEIITVALSFYFRNPAFIEFHEDEIKRIADYLSTQSRKSSIGLAHNFSLITDQLH